MNLSQFGPVGIGAILFVVGFLIFKASAGWTNGPVMNVLTLTAMIGGALLVIFGTFGFAAFVDVIAAILYYTGVVLSAIGDALQLAGTSIGELSN